MNIVKALQRWRDEDNVDSIRLTRHEIISILNEIERLKKPSRKEEVWCCDMAKKAHRDG